MNALMRLAGKYLFRGNPTPEYVIFQSTSNCNLKCSHCFLWKDSGKGWENTYKGKNDLTLDEIEKISRSMKDFFFLNIGGGEPFLRKDLPEIVKIFHTNNHVQNILIPTNGTVTKTIIGHTEKILEQNPKLHFAVDVSIDGLDGLHDRIRGLRGTFEKATTTLKELVQLKKRYKNLQVGTILTLSKDNQESIVSTYQYLKKMGLDTISLALVRGEPRVRQVKNVDLKYYEEMTRLKEQDYLENRQVKGFRKIVLWPLTVAASLLMHQIILATLKHGFQFACQANRLNTVIYSNGDVFPCEMLVDAKMGNLREVGYDFSKIWNSAKRKESAKSIIKTKCFCTHECHIPVNILFSLKAIPRLLSTALKLMK